MKRLDHVTCDYTGGGIYVYSALFNGEVWLSTDFDLFDSYDVPHDEIDAKYNYDYDRHRKAPSVPYPTWGEILQSIHDNCDESTYYDVGRIMAYYGDNLHLRPLEEPEPVPADEHTQRMTTVAAFIEIFEEFLEARGIDVPNDEKNQDPDASTIYGSDYGELSDKIETLLIELGALKEE